MSNARKHLMFLLLTFFLLLTICQAFSIPFLQESIGKSVNDKDILIYKFGEGKDLLLIIAGLHGNDKTSIDAAQYLIKQLEKIRLPNNKAVWIIPVLNPDGEKLKSRLNAHEIDLDHNFKTPTWKQYFFYVSKKVNGGPTPLSEPESQSLTRLLSHVEKKEKNLLIMHLKSPGEVIYPGNTSKAVLKLSQYLEDNSSFTIDPIIRDFDGKLTAWLVNELHIPTITINSGANDDGNFLELYEVVNKLLKKNFYKDFIRFNLDIIEQNLVHDAYYTIFRTLPESVLSKVSKSKDSFKKFLQAFYAIQTEEELLLLINKQNHLSKDYYPLDLKEIASLFETTKKTIKLRQIILDDLTELLNVAHEDNIKLVIISAFRSYQTQKSTFDYWVKTLGEEEALRVSALPGASQHQLGTTIDFNSLNVSFGDTTEGKWLLANSYKFGFIMSYPPDREEETGYKYEPWHYRYIGKDAAYLVYNYFDNNLELFLNWYWQTKI